MYTISSIMLVFDTHIEVYQIHLITSNIEDLRANYKRLINCNHINFTYGEKED